MNAHAQFDRLWRDPSSPYFRKRDRLYTRLSEFMGISRKKTHIGYFDSAQCERVVEFCTHVLRRP